MKKYCKLIPFALLPYILIFLFYILFIVTFISEIGYMVVLVPFLITFAVFIFLYFRSSVAQIKTLNQNYNAYNIFLMNLVVKLIQIPGYYILFRISRLLINVLEMLTPLYFVIVIILFTVIVYLSGFIGATGVIKLYRENKIIKSGAIVLSVFQFVIFVDMVLAVILCIKSYMYKNDKPI